MDKPTPSPKRYIKTLIFLGVNEVGKTAIIKSLTKSKFNPTYQSTICVNYSDKEILLSKHETLYFSIWDTNGLEIENSILSQSIYKRADYFILVISYDILHSLQTISNYIEYINSKQPERKVPICVIINKKDIPDKQFKHKDVIKQLEQLYGANEKIKISEISCKNNNEVKKLFDIIGYELCGIKKPKELIMQHVRKCDNGKYDGSKLVSLRNSFRIEERDGTMNGVFNFSNVEVKKKKCCD